MNLSLTSHSANFSYAYQNKTNATKCSLKSDDWTFSAIPAYIILISSLGIVLNLFVLMVFCLHKKPCNVPEIYLSNLAAADLILVSCLPFWAVNVLKHFIWPFGEIMCKVVNVGIFMNAYSSIYFLVLVSIDRYLALVHPLTLEKLREPFYAKVGCLFVWLLGFLLSLPTLVHRKLKVQSLKRPKCILDYPNIEMNLLFDSLMFVFGFAIPVCIISFCTFKIIKALNNRLGQGINVQKADNKANTLILAVLVAFLICWIPYHLTKIPTMLTRVKYITKCSHLSFHHVCQQIFTYLAFFNSVLNPVLYVLVGKNFQKKVKELFKDWRNHRTSTFRTNSSTSTYFTRSVKAQDGVAMYPRQ